MKNFLIAIITLVTLSAMADEHSGKIINLPQDEEGVRVILELKKDDVVLLYLPNNSHDFLSMVKNLKDAKENGSKLKITTTNNNMQITKIEVVK